MNDAGRRPPFNDAVLDHVERLGGRWSMVPEGADAVSRVDALRFPKRLVSKQEAFNMLPAECGLPDVASVLALDAPLPDVPVTDTLPEGVRWFGHEWQAGDIVYQWDAGLGLDFPFVDLARDAENEGELAAFREAVGDPAASRAVLLTYSDGYPNYLLINADDPNPDDPAVWSTDHESFFRLIEPEAPSLSAWLGEQMSDAEIHQFLRDEG